MTKLKALLDEQDKADAALAKARARMIPLIERVDAADEAISDYLNELCEQARKE